MKQTIAFLSVYAAAGIIIGCPFGYAITKIADLIGI